MGCFNIKFISDHKHIIQNIIQCKVRIVLIAIRTIFKWLSLKKINLTLFFIYLKL